MAGDGVPDRERRRRASPVGPARGRRRGCLSDQSRPVSDVVATAHALVAVAPGDGVVVYAGVDDDDRRDARGGTARRPRGCPIAATVTVLDGAGADGFSSCAGACDDLLAVGSKTGRCSCSTLGLGDDERRLEKEYNPASFLAS